MFLGLLWREINIGGVVKNKVNYYIKYYCENSCSYDSVTEESIEDAKTKALCFIVSSDKSEVEIYEQKKMNIVVSIEVSNEQ